jgi:hypothetical protein
MYSESGIIVSRNVERDLKTRDNSLYIWLEQFTET